jgi:outer membrane biosynthesis protein TonB
MRIGGGRREREARRGRMWPAAAWSLALHAAVVALLVTAEGAFGGRRPEPRMRVYAVNIVSPPPTLRGAPPAEPPAPNVGGSQPPAATPSAPARPAPSNPTPTPPAPKPAPPAPAPPKQPAHAAPTPPQPRPAPPRTEQAPHTAANQPKTPSAASNEAKTPPRGTSTASTTRQPGSTTGPGSGARSVGTGTRGAATGRDPDPNSAGGEGLNVSQRGAECPSPGYCENIVRQVRRWFRRPEGNNGTAEACFTILRDGSTGDIDVRRVRGGFAFRMAVEEAVEQAGLHQAFGALPRAFGATELPVCVDISPQT